MTTSPGEDRRIELCIHHALETAQERIASLRGRDRFAVQMEFLDWMAVQETDDISVLWLDDYSNWE